MVAKPRTVAQSMPSGCAGSSSSAALESRPSASAMAAAVRDGGRRRTAGCRRNDDRASSDRRAGARRWNARTSGGDRWQRWGRSTTAANCSFRRRAARASSGSSIRISVFRSRCPNHENPDPSFQLCMTACALTAVAATAAPSLAQQAAPARAVQTTRPPETADADAPGDDVQSEAALGAHRAAARIQRRARARRHPGHRNAGRRAAGRAQGARRHARLPAVQVVQAARRRVGDVLRAATNRAPATRGLPDRTASAARRCSVKCCVDPRSRSTS